MKKKDIKHLATLARIELKEGEVEALTSDITEILGYVSEINKIAATEYERKVGPLHNVMRDDEPSHEPGVYTKALLEAAPQRDGKYVKVKKILDNE